MPVHADERDVVRPYEPEKAVVLHGARSTRSHDLLMRAVRNLSRVTLQFRGRGRLDAQDPATPKLLNGGRMSPASTP